MRTVVEGRIKHLWIDQELARLVYRKHMIKDVRSSLLSRWFSVQFPEVRPVWLMWHPCAVAESVLRQGWPLGAMHFLDQPDLMADHLAPFEPLIRSTPSRFEQIILFWCVHQFVSLRQFRPGQVLLMFYERILADPEAELKRLFEFLGRANEVDRDLLTRVRKPSRLADRRGVVRTGGDPASAWRERLSPRQIQRAVELLEHFGLHKIYRDDAMPNEQAATEVLSVSPDPPIEKP